MTLYLQMDGVNDFIKPPTNLTFTRVVMDMVVKTKTGLQYLAHSTSGVIYLYKNPPNDYFGGFNTLSINGTNISNGAVNGIPANTRITLDAVSSTAKTEELFFFKRSTGIQLAMADVYNIKIYNGAALIAHYDMSTGTVQDQSGNGNHATYDGVFLDDAKTYYLSMDGVDDVLQLPSLTANKFILDCYIDSSQNNSRDVVLDTRSGSTYFLDIGFTNMRFKINGGVEQNSNTALLKDQRHNLEIYATSALPLMTDNFTVFAKNDSTTPLGGKLFNVKVYNGETLVAHYDMAKGSVQDQSGNGNHATLTGGTWLEDAPSGSVIDAGTLTLSGDTTLTINSSLIVSGNSSLSADSVLTVIGDSDVTINLTADSNLTLIGSIVSGGESTFSSDTSMSTIANVISNGNSVLSASGTLTVEAISFDPSKQVIGKINLIYKRELTIRFTNHRELTTRLNASTSLITRLVGDIK